MRLMPCAVALLFLLAGAPVGVAGNKPPGMPPPASFNPNQKYEKQHKPQKRNNWRQQADCHRDIRTHRIGGVRLTHRHVGDDCRVREVRKAN